MIKGLAGAYRRTEDSKQVILADVLVVKERRSQMLFTAGSKYSPHPLARKARTDDGIELAEYQEE
jgi:hypothetical protein